jgi:hypothetical protein
LGQVVSVPELNAVLEDHNTNMDLLEEIVLKEVLVKFIDGTTTTANFNSLEMGEIYLNCPGKIEMKIASIQSVPKDVSSLSFDINTKSNLADYFKSENFTVRLTGTNNSAIDSMDLKLEFKFAAFASVK